MKCHFIKGIALLKIEILTTLFSLITFSIDPNILKIMSDHWKIVTSVFAKISKMECDSGLLDMAQLALKNSHM